MIEIKRFYDNINSVYSHHINIWNVILIILINMINPSLVYPREKLIRHRKMYDAYFSLLNGKVQDMSVKKNQTIAKPKATFIPKPDTGTLFVNQFKKSDNHPDYTGTYAMPDGTVREVAAWINGKDDTPYITLRFSNQYVAESA